MRQKGKKTLTDFSPTFHQVNVWDLFVNFAIYTSHKLNISIYIPSIIFCLGPLPSRALDRRTPSYGLGRPCVEGDY